jgi:hypothetical protein
MDFIRRVIHVWKPANGGKAIDWRAIRLAWKNADYSLHGGWSLFIDGRLYPLMPVASGSI